MGQYQYNSAKYRPTLLLCKRYNIAKRESNPWYITKGQQSHNDAYDFRDLLHKTCLTLVSGINLCTDSKSSILIKR